MEKKYLTDEQRAARVRGIQRLAAEITELAGHLNAGNYRFLRLIAEFDREEGWVDNATHSCAHWLNWKCGIALGAAREKVRTAHALDALPKIAAAMERGELSYSKVRAITRVACSETEEYFLSLALRGTAHHVETIVRHYGRCVEVEELSKEARQQANRSVTYYWDEDGSLVLKARMPAETGALLLKALDASMEDSPSPKRQTKRYTGDFIPARCPIDEPSFEARRADGLGLMAESFMKHGAEAMTGGDRHQIVVYVSAETLRYSAAGQCEIQDGPGMAAETVRRLGCDASVVAIVEDENGEPLSVGRKTRSIPPALRRALKARDKGCRFPGCTHKRYVDAHHIHHWAHGGETKASNLVTLCRFHHRKVHEGAVLVQVLDDGALRFLQPDGRSFESVAPNYTQPLGDWRQLPAIHREHGIHIDARTAAGHWDGEACDYGLAVEVLMQQAGKLSVKPGCAHVSAGTSSRLSPPALDDGADYAREIVARARARQAANGLIECDRADAGRSDRIAVIKPSIARDTSDSKSGFSYHRFPIYLIVRPGSLLNDESAFPRKRHGRNEMTFEEAQRLLADINKSIGRAQGAAILVSRMLAKRFGPLTQEVKARVKALNIFELQDVGDRLLSAQTLDEALDVEIWPQRSLNDCTNPATPAD